MLIELILLGASIIAFLGFIFMPQIVSLLGASDLIREDAILYGRILLLSEPFFMLQNSFQSFLATAGKQKLGLRISILAGLTNVILDFTLVGILKFGITGAAVATCASEFVTYIWQLPKVFHPVNILRQGPLSIFPLILLYSLFGSLLLITHPV